MISSQGDKNLSFFCKSHSSFKTRLGVLSLYQVRFPNWLEALLLSFEYLQLLALTILVHPNVYHLSNPNNQSPFIFDFVAYLAKLINPSFFLSFTHNDSTTNVVLAIILISTLVKYLLLLYVISISWLNKTPNGLLKMTWRWLFKLQGRIACCFMTSFWVRTIVTVSDDSFSIQGISNRALIAVSATLIVLEYTVSFLLETQFCDFTPSSKRFLASKNYEMPILTLLQKFVIQMTQLFAYKNTSASLWACLVLNLIISCAREYRFFTTLPMYNYKSLLYQGDLSAIVFSLHFAHFFQQILKDSDIDFRFLVILWMIIAIMFCKLSRASVREIYTRLLTSYDPNQNPNHLLHKIFATKYLIKNTKVPADSTEKTDFAYLLGRTQTLNLPQIFNIPPRDISYDMLMNNKQEETSVFLEYLRNLNNQYKGNPLLQLNLAYQKYKSTTFHSKIIKITSNLNTNILSLYHMSSALLLFELEIKNLTQYNPIEGEKKLDLLNYMENQISMQDIEAEILKQISLRKQVCESIIGDKPDLEALYQNSQVIHQSKRLIQNKINLFLKQAPEQYLYPLLVFAEYNFYLNYSVEEYQNYYETYSRKISKFTKEFELNKISEENLYQNENAFLIISAAANNSIVYSTRSLQDICGNERNNYIGTPITGLFPHKLREYYDKIFKEIFENGQSKFTNQSIPTYISHKEGWLVEADMFIRVHPYMSGGLYLDLFIRPHQKVTNLILLDETGKVEGVTQTINQLIEAKQLSKVSLHIKQISKELSRLNQAFNIVKNKIGKVNLLRKYSKKKTPLIDLTIFQSSPEMDYEKALRLYNLYTTHSKTIKLPNNNNGSFKCDISKLDFNNFSLNLIQLEPVSRKTIHVENSPTHDLELERKPMTPTPSNRSKQFFPDLPKETEYNNETDENLISPTSSRHFFKFSFLPVSNRHQTPRQQVKPSVVRLPTKDFTKIPQGLSVSTATNEHSKVTPSNDVFKTFQRVIKTRSPQKSFNFLCLIFYGVILGTLICQIVLKSVLDATMNHLLTKTNLLNFAQRRTLQVCVIHNVARGCALLIDGILTPADMNLADTPLRSNLANMVVPEQVLTTSNEGIINSLLAKHPFVEGPVKFN